LLASSRFKLQASSFFDLIAEFYNNPSCDVLINVNGFLNFNSFLERERGERRGGGNTEFV